MLIKLYDAVEMNTDDTKSIDVSERGDVNVVSTNIMWEEVVTEESAPIDGVINIYSSNGLGPCLEKSILIETDDNSTDTIIHDITGPVRELIVEYLHNAISGGNLSVNVILRKQ